jgi:hypothetical protein
VFITDRVNKAAARAGVSRRLTSCSSRPRRSLQARRAWRKCFGHQISTPCCSLRFFILTDPPTSPVKLPATRSRARRDRRRGQLRRGSKRPASCTTCSPVVLVGNVWEAWRPVTSACAAPAACRRIGSQHRVRAAFDRPRPRIAWGFLRSEPHV